jgi:hypothetical protein
MQDKWTSEPDLAAGKSSGSDCKSRGTSGGSGSGSWLQRHLSLKRKKPSIRTDSAGKATSLDEPGAGMDGSQRCGSAPLLYISPVNSPPTTPVKQTFRRPSCVDGVVPVSIVSQKQHQSRLHGGGAGGSGGRKLVREPGVIYEDDDDGGGPPPAPAPPPQILASDFDLGIENSRRIV